MEASVVDRTLGFPARARRDQCGGAGDTGQPEDAPAGQGAEVVGQAEIVFMCFLHDSTVPRAAMSPLCASCDVRSSRHPHLCLQTEQVQMSSVTQHPRQSTHGGALR